MVNAECGVRNSERRMERRGEQPTCGVTDEEIKIIEECPE